MWILIPLKVLWRVFVTVHEHRFSVKTTPLSHMREKPPHAEAAEIKRTGWSVLKTWAVLPNSQPLTPFQATSGIHLAGHQVSSSNCWFASGICTDSVFDVLIPWTHSEFFVCISAQPLIMSGSIYKMLVKLCTPPPQKLLGIKACGE